MNPEGWRRVEEIFEAALELPPLERAAFLDRTCAGDEAVRREVVSLLVHDEQAKSFIEAPVFNINAGALAAGLSEPASGKQIDSYTVVREAGRGGMGVVYLARDQKLRRTVALKLLPQRFTLDPERVERFEQEAYAASSLNHPNILTIYDIGQSEYGHYMVTEFIDGLTLREQLARVPMKLGEALELMIQVASALKAAHAAGIVHRDIKPENVMVRPDGIVKVLDFGLAKLVEQYDTSPEAGPRFHTRPGALMGTPNYMSPEQVTGQGVDRRSDLFSFGAVLYECLTSRTAFTGETAGAVWGQIQYVEPPPPSGLNRAVPAELDRIVLKSLAKRPEDRYQSAGELLDDLRLQRQRLRDDDPVTRGGMRAPNRTSRIQVFSTLSASLKQRRFRIPLGVLALLAASLLVFAALPGRQEPDARSLELYGEGVKALRDGLYFKASKMLEGAAARDGGRALTHARLAEAWMELDYEKKAMLENTIAQKLAREQSALARLFAPAEERLYLEAVDATVRRDFDTAAKLYTQIRDGAQDKSSAYVDLGRISEKGENTAAAVENYRKALELNDENASALLRLGVLYVRKGDVASVKSAAELFKKAEGLYDRQSNEEGVTEVHYWRGFLHARTGSTPEARAELEHALRRAELSRNVFQKIRALLQLSNVEVQAQQTGRAEEYAEQAISLAQSERMENMATQGLLDLGNSFIARGKLEEAGKYYAQALRFATADGGGRNKARAQLTLAGFAMQRDDADGALSHLEQSLPFFVGGGYRLETSRALILKGQALSQKGEYEAARQAFEQQLQLAPLVEDKLLTALSHEGLGKVLADWERYPEAAEHFKKSFETFDLLGRKLNAGYSLMFRGNMLTRLGLFDEAAALFQQAHPYARNHDGSSNKLLFWLNLNEARMAAGRGLSAEASEKAAKALSLAESPNETAEAKISLGRAGQPDAARLFQEALEQARKANNPKLAAGAQLALSELLLASGKASESAQHASQALATFARLGQQESEWRARLVAGRAGLQAGDSGPALEQLALARDILANLERTWGGTLFDSYRNRADVKPALVALDEGLAAVR